MALFTTLAALSQNPASNAPDGTTDAPSTIDDQLRLLAAFVAQIRDGKAGVAEVDVAASTAPDIGGANSSFIRITGSGSTITSFGTSYNGPRFIRFAGANTINHNSASLILPGGASITTAAGDTCLVVPVGNSPSGWQVAMYTKADGTPLGTSALLGTSGSYRFPGGLMIQWGGAIAGQNGSSYANSFPSSFSSAVWAVIPVHFGSDSSVNVVVDSVSLPTTTSFSLRSNFASGTVQCYYIAIGR